MPEASGKFSRQDRAYMARALKLALGGRYSTRPNPRVGCVLVNEGRIVGEGFHYRAGEDHAEAAALKLAGSAAHGATAYVTLEPCAHQGRTPPCARGLIEAGVARVVYAAGDPNPRVAGGGAQLLRTAGITCEGGLLADEARAQNRGFLMRCERGRPFVTLKLGMSLDARVALADGSSQWITSAEARADVQRLRASSCAVLTGSGTVLADDPGLDVRDPRFDLGGHPPGRIILDSALRTPPGARILTPPGQVWIFCAEGAERDRAERLRARGAQVETLPRAASGLDLPILLKRLAALEINDLMVESGPALAANLLGAGLVDELVLYVAPLLLGPDARAAFAWPALHSLAEAPHMAVVEVARVGVDQRLVLRPGSP